MSDISESMNNKNNVILLQSLVKWRNDCPWGCWQIKS